jgi:amino acid permease
MLELLGVLTFISHFISCVCLPAVSCSLPKYFKLKPPEYKKYRKLVHMVCLTHPVRFLSFAFVDSRGWQRGWQERGEFS